MKNMSREPWGVLSRLFRTVEAKAEAYIPYDDLCGLNSARKLNNWKCFPLDDNRRTRYWAALSCGKNVYLPSHTDQDSFLSCTLVVAEGSIDLEAPVTNYFCFPSHGISVPLCPGDLLLFNPLVYHSISSRTHDVDVFCLSFYLKTALVGGNDNQKKFSEDKLCFLEQVDYRI